MKKKLKLSVSKRKAKTAKRKIVKRRARKVNPAPLLYIITAQGSGRKMSYDGVKFSERSKIRLFKTADEAIKCAEGLVAKYPLLRKYKVAVETNQHRPGK